MNNHEAMELVRQVLLQLINYSGNLVHPAFYNKRGDLTRGGGEGVKEYFCPKFTREKFY